MPECGQKKETGGLNRTPVSVGCGRLCGALATLCLKRGMSSILDSQDYLVASADGLANPFIQRIESSLGVN